MIRQLPTRSAIASAGVLLSLALAIDARAQTDVTWVAGTGNWSTGSNWEGNGGFPPEGGFGEQAVINNGGVAQLSVPYINDLSTLGGPGNLILAQEPGDSGTLEMTGTGELLLETGTNVNRFVDVGAGEIGTGGVGMLLMSDTSRIQMNNFFSGGDLQSLVSVSDSATIFAENDITLRATTRVSGSSATIEATNNLTFGGNGIYNPQISAATTSTLLAGNTATLNGTLSLDFDGYSPSVGDTWDLVSAPTVTGSFNTIEVASGFTLGTGQSFVVNSVADGDNTIAQLTLTQVLSLLIDRDTGAISIENAGTDPLSFDGYQLSSAGGAFGGVWNSLGDQYSDWDAAPNSSATALAETNPEGSLELAGASSQSLGTPYAPTFANFGESPDDGMTFTYRDAVSGALVDGEIEFTGDEIFNNMVLTVDPTTGEVAISNDSPVHTADIDAYSISSSTGSLIAGNWDSLADQGVSGDSWDDASSSNGDSFLGELNPSDSTAFDDSTQFLLGDIVNVGTVLEEGDITFEFLLTGETAARTGVVVFGEIEVVDDPMLLGDADGDGDVDGDDLIAVQTNFGAVGSTPLLGDGDFDGDVDGDDLIAVQTNFGNTLPSSVSVPEPAGASIVVIAAAGLAASRRRSV